MWVITGALGFIGSELVRHLNRLGVHQLALVDRVLPEERPLNHEGLRYERFVLAQDLFAFLNQVGPRAVQGIFHLGANSSTLETSWENLKQWNIDYSKTIWDWCVTHSCPLVYASSAATYGDGSLGYDDTLPANQLKPLNLYGESKRLFDEFVEGQSRRPPQWWGLKFFNVYGPGEFYKGEMASVVYKAFWQIRKTGKLKLFKSYRPEYAHGEQKRDFVYVKDVTRWMWDLMQKKPESGIYNMGSGRARSWNDLARAVFESLGYPVQIDYIEMPEDLRGRYQYFTEANMTRWHQLGLGEARWTLESGIDDYVKELQAKEASLIKLGG